MANDAYKKFLASAPTDQREFRTIEIHHPRFAQIYRFVKDFENQTLRLEGSAPRNSGQEVLFTALSMEIKEPSENIDNEQILSITLGAVGNEVEDALKTIIGEDYFNPIELVYRKYYSGDIDQPVLVLNLTVSTFNFSAYSNVSFAGEDMDLANKSSGEKYTLERFPTLEGI